VRPSPAVARPDRSKCVRPLIASFAKGRAKGDQYARAGRAVSFCLSETGCPMWTRHPASFCSLANRPEWHALSSARRPIENPIPLHTLESVCHLRAESIAPRENDAALREPGASAGWRSFKVAWASGPGRGHIGELSKSRAERPCHSRTPLQSTANSKMNDPRQQNRRQLPHGACAAFLLANRRTRT
jgi:hypothetical protein